MKNKIVIIASVLFVSSFLTEKMHAQIISPFGAIASDDSTRAKGDSTSLDTAIQKQNEAEKKDLLKLDVTEKENLESNKRKVALLELEKEKLKLEQEISHLLGQAKLSPEEKKLLKQKNENLLLLAQKEKLIYQQELDGIIKKSKAKNLPSSNLYGHQIFRSGDIEFFQKSNEITPTEGYVLGSNDVVHIELWGSRYWSKDYSITEYGAIDIQGYQKIFVKGLTIRQARQLIANRLNLGAESSFSITVTRPRMVSVNIIGEVYYPGTYTLPATNSAFNFLISMGGPSDIGSVRNIYIKRDGVIADSFDLYEYFTNISHPKDVYLQNNDYLIVMPLQNTVKITGGVRRPGLYELKNGETINDAIQYAGGLENNAYTRDITYTKLATNSFDVISLNLDSLNKLNKKIYLNGGDEINIKTITKDNIFTASVTGAISVPGTYKILKGTKLSSLIKRANGVKSNAYLQKAFLIRKNSEIDFSFIEFNLEKVINNSKSSEDIELQSRDSIVIFANAEMANSYTIQIYGAVKRPIITPFVSELTLGDFIFMANGLREDADSNIAYIVRTFDATNKEVIAFKPSEINLAKIYNIKIYPKDIVRILGINETKDIYNMQINGAVRNSVNQNFAKNTRVSTMLAMAGGLKEDAFKTYAIVLHSNPFTGIRSSETINLEKIINSPGGPEDIVLNINDEIKIFNDPKVGRNFEVSINGFINKAGEYKFYDNLTLETLIQLAGGFKLEASGATIELIRTFSEHSISGSFQRNSLNIIKINSNLELEEKDKKILIFPFDKIFVRKNPNFQTIKLITISGAVVNTGNFAMLSNSDNMNSIIDRVAGFLPGAALEFAYIKRKKGIEFVNIPVNLYRKSARNKTFLLEGDTVIIPYRENAVFIEGEVNISPIQQIGATYTPGKRARHYIRNNAGGYSNNANKKNVVVIYPNGIRRGTKNFIFFTVTPKVKAGSKIIVYPKVSGTKTNNIDAILTKTTARLTALISLLALYKIATK